LLYLIYIQSSDKCIYFTMMMCVIIIIFFLTNQFKHEYQVDIYLGTYLTGNFQYNREKLKQYNRKMKYLHNTHFQRNLFYCR